MNLNQFQYLLAIHKCGSITKAAQELFVSVPSISSAIKNLEDELGCTLLLRHRHGVTFTEQGEEAVRLLAEVEERLEALGKLAYYQDTNLTGQIKLGGTPHLNHSLVLPMLVHIRDSYPELKITPVDGDSPSILRMVAQGSLDLGVILFCNIDEGPFLREIRQQPSAIRRAAARRDVFCGAQRASACEQRLCQLKRDSQFSILHLPQCAQRQNPRHFSFSQS